MSVIHVQIGGSLICYVYYLRTCFKMIKIVRGRRHIEIKARLLKTSIDTPFPLDKLNPEVAHHWSIFYVLSYSKPGFVHSSLRKIQQTSIK